MTITKKMYHKKNIVIYNSPKDTTYQEIKLSVKTKWIFSVYNHIKFNFNEDGGTKGLDIVLCYKYFANNFHIFDGIF